jgi:hypothetical protein
MAQGKITISSIAKLQGWLWDVAATGFGARRQEDDRASASQDEELPPA